MSKEPAGEESFEEMRARLEAEVRGNLAQEQRKKLELAARQEAELKARLEIEIRAKLEAEMRAKRESNRNLSGMPPAPPAPTPPPASLPKPPVPAPVAVAPVQQIPAAEPVKEGPLVLEYGSVKPGQQSWSIEMPLVPIFNMETLVVHSNRFAHAAGMAAIESPGVMYNPLFLHGHGCCGKSHFLHAIAYGMSQSMGQQNIFVTDGIRFSRGVLRLAAEGKLDSLEKTLSACKALFIDDLHLMSVTDGNQAFLRRWLNAFPAGKKQLVMTSLYSPQQMAKLSGALGVNLDQASVFKINSFTPTQMKSIAKTMVARCGMPIKEEDANRYLLNADLDLRQVADILDKLRVMSSIGAGSGLPDYSSMLAEICGDNEEKGTLMPSEEDIRAAASCQPAEGTSWGRWGFFCPKGMKQYFPWVIGQLCSKMKDLDIGGGFDSSVQMDYDAANLRQLSFAITDICLEQGLRGVVVVLPPDEFASEQARSDFADTLEHLTTTLFIRCAMIDARSLARPSAYLGAVLNMVA